MARTPTDSRSLAEKAFKSATTKPADLPGELIWKGRPYRLSATTTDLHLPR